MSIPLKKLKNGLRNGTAQMYLHDKVNNSHWHHKCQENRSCVSDDDYCGKKWSNVKQPASQEHRDVGIYDVHVSGKSTNAHTILLFHFSV